MTQPPDRRGWWYLLSVLSTPFLFIARSGLFGRDAREESDIALGDWAAYAHLFLPALATILVGVVLGVVVVVLLR